MSRAALLLVVAILLSCAPREESAPDTMAMTPETTGASYAGTWTIEGMPEDRDTVLLTYSLVGTEDRTGWTVTLPGREPMETRVVWMDADSLVLESGPFPSALRENEMLTTHNVLRLEGGRLVGTTTAHYETTGADSVATFRIVGTRR